MKRKPANMSRCFYRLTLEMENTIQHILKKIDH